MKIFKFFIYSSAIFSLILSSFAQVKPDLQAPRLDQEASYAAKADEPSDGGVIDNPVFRSGLDQRSLIPNHPPIDEIPPMPMPDEALRDSDFDEEATTSVIVYNSESGETMTYDAKTFNASKFEGEDGGGFEGVKELFAGERAAEDESFTNRSFSNMFQVGAATTWPRRGNVKLVMRFVDTSGADRFFVCSGTMGDAGVVLTAAHCVYAREAAGPDIFDWAEEVWVYPGWDGNGNLSPNSNETINHWGWARGTWFMAGSDYVNNGNFNRDAGLIRLTDRSVGMLTGWYGWAWGYGCSTIKNRNYYNYSFPAENCPIGGLHNGRDMYFWGGSVDSCPGNQLQLNTGGGNCFDTVWGGMSGSGMYYTNGSGNRVVHAVCSNSNRTTRGRYTKLWQQFVTDMQAFENTTRGNTFDVEALMFRNSGSTTVPDGGSLGASSVKIANATNNNPASKTYTLRVYLSTNNNISQYDTLLATWNYTVDFAAMQTRTFNVPAPRIPAGTAPGTYWVGVVIDSGADGNFSNNDTDTWDAQQITVY